MVALDRQETSDRKELVQPTPRGWKPQKSGRGLAIRLIPEKTILRKGEKLRYCLEIRNIGDEIVSLVEVPVSFIKSGSLHLSQGFEFYVTPPGGKTARMLGSYLEDRLVREEIEFPENWTEGQKAAAFERLKANEKTSGGLQLALHPGETLSTRPDTPPPNRFRDLASRFQFDKPGTYRIRAVYAPPRPNPPNQATIVELEKRGIPRERQMKSYEDSLHRWLGRNESNEVTIEVAP